MELSASHCFVSNVRYWPTYAFGVKRTRFLAPTMSANDPKRTLASSSNILILAVTMLFGAWGRV
jgi:hypothetical protein